LIEERLNNGLTESQRFLIVAFFGYLDLELPPSFPTGLLLQCFKQLPPDLPSFTKQHLKKSFRLLFVHNLQNSARAEWLEHLELMATRDKQFSFLKNVSVLPQVAKVCFSFNFVLEYLNLIKLRVFCWQHGQMKALVAFSAMP
jgi:hypothetical protein